MVMVFRSIQLDPTDKSLVASFGDGNLCHRHDVYQTQYRNLSPETFSKEGLHVDHLGQLGRHYYLEYRHLLLEHVPMQPSREAVGFQDYGWHLCGRWPNCCSRILYQCHDRHLRLALCKCARPDIGKTTLIKFGKALLPIPMLWSVKMTKQAKATVIAILGLGILYDDMRQGC